MGNAEDPNEGRGDFGMTTIGSFGGIPIHAAMGNDFPCCSRHEPAWYWQPQPKFVGWLRRSCCKAPDTMSHHYGDCEFYDESEVNAAPRRIINDGEGGGFINLGVKPVTSLARRILSKHMPYALEHFLRRNAEYGDDNDFNLGSRGQYVDISRKVQKLKRLMWDGEPELDGAESARTIVVELIGHLLMTMDYMEAYTEDGCGQDGQLPR